jgi:hypothetical protein
VHASRKAKEGLFGNEELQSITISVPSRGSGLLAGTVTVGLPRELLEGITINGFFEKTDITDLPLQETSIGLQELGLAYAAEPVISKHLAEFLTKSLRNVRANAGLSESLAVKGRPERLSGEYLKPDAVLFNGGVFKAKPLRDRVVEILQGWNPEGEVKELHGTNFDLAVAEGASRYGFVKLSGKGIRIRSTVARSYYIGLEPSMPAIPGYRPPIKAVCVAEQGMEEGQERVLAEKEFGLVTGATVRFRFFSSAERAGDHVGSIVPNAEKELEETTSLEMTLPVMEELEEQAAIPVKLHTRLNELGVLQLWMQHTMSQKKWELNFSVRTE